MHEWGDQGRGRRSAGGEGLGEGVEWDWGWSMGRTLGGKEAERGRALGQGHGPGTCHLSQWRSPAPTLEESEEDSGAKVELWSLTV